MKKYIRNFCLAVLGISFVLGKTQSTEAAEKKEKLKDIRVGCDEYEPYSYFDENGNLAGIDADLASEAFNRIGYDPVYILMKWTEKDTYLDEGMIDCIWAAFSMNGRENDYLWSEPYMYSRESVVVKEDSDIQTLDDLNDRKIATLANTRAEDILLKKEIFPHLQPETVYSFQHMNEGIAALKQGYVDAAAGDRLYMQRYMENYPGKLRIIEESLETSRLAVAFSKDADSDLVEKLNDTLQEMKLDGTIDQILEKYQAEENLISEDSDSE